MRELSKWALAGDSPWRLEELEPRLAPAVVQVSMVKDIVAGSGSSEPTSFVNVDGTLFFASNLDLWKSDGTADGTALVHDFSKGLGLYFSQFEGGTLAAVDDILFFSDSGDSHGWELWKSDGTSAGTVLVKDIRPGSDRSKPKGLTNVNGTLFFTANDGVLGYELWKSDGTCAGTVLVKDIRPGNPSSFSWFDTPALVNVGGTLFFVAQDATSGLELWKSDGTCEGTVLVKDIRPAPHGGFPSQGDPTLANVNGTLFFRANDGILGYELWKSDGTCDGTVLVKDIRPGADGYGPAWLTNVDGTLFFAAENDAVSGLWKSDGTCEGTVPVMDVPISIFSGVHPFKRLLAHANGIVYFAGFDDAHGWELWKSDGTSLGTVMAQDIVPGSDGSWPRFLTSVNGVLFFNANSELGLELWMSDGTGEGTVLVKDIWPGSGSTWPSDLMNVNGTLFFRGNDGVNGTELWKAVIVDPPPVVTDVFVGGTGWTAGFETHLETQALGEAGPGYRLPTGSADQLATLPWMNLNQISIRFDQDVAIGFDALSLYGVSVTQYTLDPAGFTYDAETFTATWTLDDGFFANDKLLLRLDEELGGGVMLDGEWTDGVSTVSGDGTAGGEFHFRFNVLPGDANQNSAVFVNDVLAARDAQFRFPGQPGYSHSLDVDGSGSIFVSDVLAIRDRQFTFLPPGEPQIPEGDEGWFDIEGLIAGDSRVDDSDTDTPTSRDLFFAAENEQELATLTMESAPTSLVRPRPAPAQNQPDPSLVRRRWTHGSATAASAEDWQTPALG